MEIIWTGHAIERQQEWQRKLGITRQDVEAVVGYPEQVVAGDLDALVAQAKRGDGLLRIPFVEVEGGRKILRSIGPARSKSTGGKSKMRIRYDPDADILLFILRDLPPVDAVEEAGGVIISYGDDGEAVSVEFLHASARHLIHVGEISVTLQSERAYAMAG